MEKIIAYQAVDEYGHAITPIIRPFEGARRQVVVTPASFTCVEKAETEASKKRFEVGIISAVTRAETDAEFLAWVGAKDVPAGVPYKISDASDVPEGDAERAAWFDTLRDFNGVGIGADAWFTEQENRNARRERELQDAYTEILEELKVLNGTGEG